MSAERAVIEIELVPDVLVDGVRNANSARLRQSLEPGGDIDPVTENIVAVDDHVPEIDADPQLEPALRRDRIVDRTHGTLHLDGAVQRIDDARKICQQAVARGANDPSAMRRDQWVDSAAQLTEGTMGASLVLPHQTAETNYIRVQNGSKLALPKGRVQDISHRRPHYQASGLKAGTSRMR